MGGESRIERVRNEEMRRKVMKVIEVKSIIDREEILGFFLKLFLIDVITVCFGFNYFDDFIGVFENELV